MSRQTKVRYDSPQLIDGGLAPAPRVAFYNLQDEDPQAQYRTRKQAVEYGINRLLTRAVLYRPEL
jgi:hypothetical protein